jgi:hypothetical protein
MLHGVPEEQNSQFIDGYVRLDNRLRDPAPVGFPFAQDASILGPALWRVVLAEEYVTTTAAPIGERDDRLTGLFVETVGRN